MRIIILIPFPFQLLCFNRFHVAMHRFSNRSQMTPKCGKNKTVAHEVIAECVTDETTRQVSTRNLPHNKIILTLQGDDCSVL